MNTYFIFLAIWIGIIINLFRWAKIKDSENLWIFAGIVTLFPAFIFIMIALTGSFNNEKILIEKPAAVIYSNFGPTNYLMYRINETDPVYLEWIGNLEEESKKKFYRVKKYNLFGAKLKDEPIERY